MVEVRTQRLTRDLVAQIAGGNQRSIKAVEALLDDVAQTLPEAINDLEREINGARAAADVARIVADEALDAAEAAAADALLAGSTARAAETTAKLAADTAEGLQHVVGVLADLRETVAALAGRVNDLEIKP